MGDRLSRSLVCMFKRVKVLNQGQCFDEDNFNLSMSVCGIQITLLVLLLETVEVSSEKLPVE